MHMDWKAALWGGVIKRHRLLPNQKFNCRANFVLSLCQVLVLQHYSLQVPCATFVPSHLVCLFTIGRQSALVVDVGFKETTILPVSLNQMLAWEVL